MRVVAKVALHMLEFVKGNAEEPTGNLIVYCYVNGRNPFHPGGKIILSNVVVSFLSARTNMFPVVVFPPVSLMTEDDLDQVLEINEFSDVMQLYDFEMPEGEEEGQNYVNERMSHFNQVVMEYVEYCRGYIGARIRDDDFLPEPQEFEADFTLEAPAAAGPERQAEENALSTLPDDEKSTLENLERLMGHAPRNQEDSHFRNVVRHIEARYPKYDIRNFLRGLQVRQSVDAGLHSLYMKKFWAIYEENYEQAARIQGKINRLEKSLSLSPE